MHWPKASACMCLCSAQSTPTHRSFACKIIHRKRKFTQRYCLLLLNFVSSVFRTLVRDKLCNFWYCMTHNSPVEGRVQRQGDDNWHRVTQLPASLFGVQWNRAHCMLIVEIEKKDDWSAVISPDFIIIKPGAGCCVFDSCARECEKIFTSLFIRTAQLAMHSAIVELRRRFASFCAFLFFNVEAHIGGASGAFLRHRKFHFVDDAGIFNCARRA